MAIEPKKKTVFLSTIYRIPALLYVRENKTLLAFAELRSSEADSTSQLLVMKTGTVKEESGVKTVEWTSGLDFKPVEKAQKDGYRPMNPCPVYDERSKTLFLFFICVEGTVEELWQINHNTNKARLCYITSTDLGKSWSKVKDLTDQLDEIKNWSTFGVGPGHGVQMKSGTLIVPVYGYVKKDPPVKDPYALALYSNDSGKTWQFGNKLATNSLECEMAEFFDEEGKSFLYCNARTTCGIRVEAISENDGEDFSLLLTSLNETGKGCQGSVVSFPAQKEGSDTEGSKVNKWLLFTHPSDKKERINLGVYLNKTPKDAKDANAWSKPRIINRGPSGYSDVAYIDDGWFVCLVECGVEKETEQIASVVFYYKDLIKAPEESCCIGCCCAC